VGIEGENLYEGEKWEGEVRDFRRTGCDIMRGQGMLRLERLRRAIPSGRKKGGLKRKKVWEAKERKAVI